MIKVFCFIIILIVLFCTSCSINDNKNIISEKEDYELFYNSNIDSISTFPLTTKHKALLAYQNSNDTLYRYKYLSIVMTCCMFSSDMDSVLLLANKIIDYVNNNNKHNSSYLLLECESYNALGNIYTRIGKLNEANIYYQKAFNLLLQLSNNSKIINLALNIADNNNRLGKLDIGAMWYRKALIFSDSLKKPEIDKIPAYYGLAEIYASFRDFKRCNYYYNLVSKHFKDMSPFEKQVYLNNCGNSYYFMNDYKTAIQYFKKVIKLTNYHKEMIYEKNLAYLNLGDCYLRLNDIESAKKCIKLCSTFFYKSNNTLCIYYLKVQNFKLAILCKNYTKAKNILSHSIIYKDIPYPEIMSIRNEYIQQFYELSGDYKSAYTYLIKNAAINDSVRSERSAMRTADLSSLYQQDSTIMSQKYYIINKEEEVNKLHYIIILGISFFIVFVVCIIILLLYIKKRRDLQKTKSLSKIQAMHLENLRNRLSPHFIFNILNQEIASETEEKKNRLFNLVKLIRQNLEIADKLSISLEDELDFLNSYLKTIVPSLGDDFYPEINIDPSINIKSKFLPSMIIQIPVENSIKHGLIIKKGTKRLIISIKQLAKGIEIKIIDNGGGFKQICSNKGTGTGLKVLTQSIHTLNAKNSEKINIIIKNITLSNNEVGCETIYYIPDNYNYEL